MRGGREGGGRSGGEEREASVVALLWLQRIDRWPNSIIASAASHMRSKCEASVIGRTRPKPSFLSWPATSDATVLPSRSVSARQPRTFPRTAGSESAASVKWSTSEREREHRMAAAGVLAPLGARRQVVHIRDRWHEDGERDRHRSRTQRRRKGGTRRGSSQRAPKHPDQGHLRSSTNWTPPDHAASEVDRRTCDRASGISPADQRLSRRVSRPGSTAKGPLSNQPDRRSSSNGTRFQRRLSSLENAHGPAASTLSTRL